MSIAKLLYSRDLPGRRDPGILIKAPGGAELRVHVDTLVWSGPFKVS